MSLTARWRSYTRRKININRPFKGFLKREERSRANRNSYELRGISLAKGSERILHERFTTNGDEFLELLKHRNGNGSQREGSTEEKPNPFLQDMDLIYGLKSCISI